MSDLDNTGVVFPLTGEKRSSTAVGRETLAHAADAVDPGLARRIRATSNWRKEYLAPARDLVVASAASTAAADAVAHAGLRYLHDSFEFSDGASSVPLHEAVAGQTDDELSTRTFIGGGEVDPVLRIPFRGSQLEGSDIRRQVSAWLTHRVVEPSFAVAIQRVLDNPEWLDLRGHRFVVLGAGAELGPLATLLRCGAEVWAVDLPRPDTWQRLISLVQGTAGILHVPVPADSGIGPAHSDDEVAAVAGADLIRAAPAVARWLSHLDGPLIIGNYGYADGALNVRLSMACDAISIFLIDTLGRDQVTLAYLATPTDAFQVPMEIVDDAREQWRHHLLARFTRRPLALANLFQPNYRRLVQQADGGTVGVADCLIEQQGPNYLLAKRMQRWRATVCRVDGVHVSLNVAPSTRTQSVIRNKLMAAAYGGASRFGIEVFEPETCNAVMAALLVRDLRDPASYANPAVSLDHPADLFSQAAAHGGMWRSPYDPRSVLKAAAVLGMIEQSM